MKLYHVIKEDVYMMTYDEMDEYFKNHFKETDDPSEVSISFKDACPFLKDNAGKYEVNRDEDYQKNIIYVIFYDYGMEILKKGYSLIITKEGSLYTIKDNEITPEIYLEA